jgi:hypothetical protein
MASSSKVIGALRPGWRWLLAIGVAVPLLLGLVLASAIAISWVTGNEYTPPAELEAGAVVDSTIGDPKLFEEDDVWVVRLAGGEFLALYDRGIESGCPLQWRREFEFMGRSGWFVDACTGSAYDLTGRCFSDACRGRSLSRFRVIADGDHVTVGLRVPNDAPPDTDAQPVNPPGR